VLSVAGWREAPPASPRRPEQARQEIERQDLDLTPRQGVAARGRQGGEA
jgi:hypothetical protein